MSPEYLRVHGKSNGGGNTTVAVPCKPLRLLMADAGMGGGAGFLSLDVEGAEDRVFDTVDPALFGLVMAEADGYDPLKDSRVEQRAINAGMRISERVRVRASTVFLRRDVKEMLQSPLPAGYLPLHGYRIMKYRPKHETLRDELAQALLS